MNNNNIDDTINQLNTVDDLKSSSQTKHVCQTRCTRLDAYDWLNNFPFPEDKTPFHFVEIRFKYNRREFFSYDLELDLHQGDVVAVEAEQGHDIGIVSLIGEIVRLQMERKDVSLSSNFKKVYRKARIQDIERWIQSIERENKTLTQTRQIISDLQLDMKLDDLEFRGDGLKAIFYYTANKRIDFRELIKILAERFRIKVEMKQIGIRQEAAKVGGIGSCGREMCCSQWISAFQSVSTQSARIQQLPINPQKLAGQCGKLKCCLNYEQDVYVDAIRHFPQPHIHLKTKQGHAFFVKSDVFKNMLTYSYNDNGFTQYVELPLQAVWKIIKLNEQAQYPEKLEDFLMEENVTTDGKMNFNQVNQDDLNRFDKQQRHNRRNNNRKKGNRPYQNNGNNKKA